MEQKELLRISLIISLIGIFLLLFLAKNLELKQINIRNINNNLLNQKVKIHGTILRIIDKETFKIFSVADGTGKIDVLCECKNNSITPNQDIVITGTVQDYKKNFQISADKIIRLNK